MSETNPKHIMVMTGATSGIGAQADKQFVASPDTLVLTGVRGKGCMVSGAEVFPLDLASLASVRAFADAVKQRLGDAKIEMLVLNAGAQFPKDQRSVDGFEMTFATNHLSPSPLCELVPPTAIYEHARAIRCSSRRAGVRPRHPSVRQGLRLSCERQDYLSGSFETGAERRGARPIVARKRDHGWSPDWID